MPTDHSRVTSRIQRLLDFQMPSGEWGSQNVPLKDRYVRVNREDVATDHFLTLFRKPNAYRTLTASEVLRDYCGTLFDNRIKLATGWLTKSMAAGWFSEWEVTGSGMSPDLVQFPHVEKLPDVRHTAQALLQLLKFERRYSPNIVVGVKNVLSIQSESGLWPKRLGSSEYELFGTACCLDVLYTASRPERRARLRRFGLNSDLESQVQIAIDRANSQLAALLQENPHGLWIDEYQTAMVLERLGPWYVADRRYKFIVDKIAEALIERFDRDGWYSASVYGHQQRQNKKHRYETTVRILAGLSQTYKGEVFGFFKAIEPAYDFIEKYVSNNTIDSSDYRYLIRIEDPSGTIRVGSSEELYDYLSVEFQRSKDADDKLLHQIDVFAFWIVDAFSRLTRLMSGRDFGMPNYAEAYREKEREVIDLILSLLPLLHDTVYEVGFRGVLEFLRTSDLRHLETLPEFRVRGHGEHTRDTSLGAKLYGELKDVATEVIARYLTQLTRGT